MRSFVLWAALAALFARSEARSCYFPDGTPSGTDVPCTDDPVGDSFCCFTGQACLSNKVCGAFHTNSTGSFMTFARGTCTDSSWNSPACPKFCLDVQNRFGNRMFSCNTTEDAYCCNGGCTCDANHEVHTFDSKPYTQTIISNPATFSTPSASITQSSSTSTGAAAAAAAATTTDSGSSAAAAPASGSNGTAIGVGVGVGIGSALLVLGLGFLLYRRMQKRREKQAGLEASASRPGAAEVPGGGHTPAWKKKEGHGPSGSHDYSLDGGAPPQYHRTPEAPSSPFVPELPAVRPLDELPAAPTAHEAPGHGVRR